VRHVGLKQVTHMLHYTTYAFTQILYMKKSDLAYSCPTEEQHNVRH
jgi:hypothetical protein